MKEHASIIAPRWHNGCMTHFISRWIVLTIAAGVMVFLLPGMQPIGKPAILGVAAFALVLSLINASIKPVVHVLALPLSILSFGLIALIINWLFMRLASWLALSIFGVGVFISGFWWSVLGSVIMTIVSSIVGGIIGE
jgi:putative membrane protein